MAIDTTSERDAREAFAQNPFPDLPWIRIRDDGIAVLTGYSEALHRLLRWVPKAKWHAAERCWLVPFSGAEAVRAVLPEITRLAEAARELDAPAQNTGPEIIQRLVEAAELVHGPDWRMVLAARETGGRIADWIEGRSVPGAGDPLVGDLVAALRAKAAAFLRAAERLESGLGAGRGSDRT